MSTVCKNKTPRRFLGNTTPKFEWRLKMCKSTMEQKHNGHNVNSNATQAHKGGVSPGGRSDQHGISNSESVHQRIAVSRRAPCRKTSSLNPEAGIHMQWC